LGVGFALVNSDFPSLETLSFILARNVDDPYGLAGITLSGR